jgi:acetolactate synthase-1/2/3 large subunit
VIRVAEYIADVLANRGVRHVFMLTGGGAMFLNFAIGGHPRIRTIFNLHEQACAMAAEGYARMTGMPGVLNVTSGPGGVNALNGVLGAWTDSIPMLVLSGQVKRETYLRTYDLPGLRQLGDQEADIISMVRGITKYAVTVSDPLDIRYHLEKAWHLARAGRSGPCWLDIPVDVQSSPVDPNQLRPFLPPADRLEGAEELRQQVATVLEKLARAERPVILAGTGVRLAGAVELFNRVIHKLAIPVTTGWTHDIIDSDDSVFCGRPGTIGTRAGNFAVQSSDLLLVLGSRLNVRQTGYTFKSFARAAYKIWVDIDPAELSRPTVSPDLPIVADLHAFLEELDHQVDALGWDADRHAGWLGWCKDRHLRYPAVLPRHREFTGRINPYHFIDTLFAHLEPDEVVVCGNATATIVPFQVARLRLGQRLFSNSGAASMGYDLPAAIGAAVAREGKRVICLAGDGSIQLNLQELQTVAQYRLPIKLFVLNNGGYLSIRLSQRGFFPHTVGESPQSGVSFPDMVAVATAYGLPARRIDTADFEASIRSVLGAPGPSICDVVLDPEQGFEPRQSSRQLPDGRIISAPLEDMYPFLGREELRDNLLIPEWEG